MKSVKVVSFLLTFTIVLSVGITAFAELIDISTHWANKEISHFVEKGILNGYPDGTFKPQNFVTKAEIYKIINKVMGYTEVAEVNFLDVKEADWFYQDVAKGLKVGYITAKPGGNLVPKAPITRGEVASIIGISFGLFKDGPSSTKTFLDEYEIAPEAKEFVSILRDKGYISGYPDGTFKPDGFITRAEVAKIINNISRNPITKEEETKIVIEKVKEKEEKYKKEKPREEFGSSSGVIIHEPDPIPQIVPVNGVSVSLETMELTVGTQETITATVSPLNATNKNITWSSGDHSIAIVNNIGLVTAISVGETTIKVTTVDVGMEANVVITVVEEADPIPEPLTLVIEEITGLINTLKLTFNKDVIFDGIALGSIPVTESVDKLEFLNKLFNTPEDLANFINADSITIDLTDTSVSVSIEDNAIIDGLFQTLDKDRNGIWRMDVELNTDNFKDVDNQVVKENIVPFMIKFSSFSNKHSLGNKIDYSADVKAVFQTKAQMDEEFKEKEVNIEVQSGATAVKSEVTISTNFPIGTNLGAWSGNGSFTKDGVFLLARLYKVEGKQETPVFFRSVFDKVVMSSNILSEALTYSNIFGAGSRKGGDFSNLGAKSTMLFKDKGIKDSQFRGALIYGVEISESDIYSLWIPAGSINLTLTNTLRTDIFTANYVIYLEVYAPGYKDVITDTKWSNSDTIPLLAKVKVVDFTVHGR